MITVSCPIKQDYIISLLDGKEIDGIQFKFLGKKGIDLQFEISPNDREFAVSVAKKTIKSTEIGSVLYFRVI